MKLVQRLGILVITIAVVVLASRFFGQQPDVSGTSQSEVQPLAPVILEQSAPVAPDRTQTLIQQLQDKIKADPNDQHSLTLLGSGYLQRARETGDPTYYNLAEQALNSSLKLDPNDVDALVAKGSLMLSRHQFSDALALGEKTLAISPHRASVYGLIGDAQIELGMYDQSVNTIQNMVNIRPDLSSYARVSYVRELHGDIEGAIEMMDRAVRAGGANAENTNWSRVQLGNLYFNKGDLANAEHSFAEALNSQPGYLHALAGMGNIAAAKGDLTKAADYYKQATNVVPVPQYVATLGDIYTKLGDTANAKKEYDLFTFIAQTYKINGVLFGIEGAMFYADHDMDLDQALQQAEDEAVTRKDVHTHDTLAWVLYKMGRYDEAWQHAQEATRLGSQEPLILFHAGMIAAKVGQPEKARALLGQVMKLNPHFNVHYADVAAQALKDLN